MRVVSKKYYYFEEEDKGLFTDFLLENHTKMNDFATLCGITLAYLSLVINGKRAITPSLMKKFEENGFKVLI